MRVTGWPRFQVYLRPLVESPSSIRAVFVSLLNNLIDLFNSSFGAFKQDVGLDLRELPGPIVGREASLRPLFEEKRCSQPFELGYTIGTDLIGHEGDAVAVLRQGLRADALNVLTAIGGSDPGSIRPLRFQSNQPIGTIACKFVPQIERKRSVFVQNEIEAQRDLHQILDEKGGFLDVGFSAPTTLLT